MKGKNLYLYFLITLLPIFSFSMKPEKEYSQTPDELGIPFEEVTIKTTDNFHLNAWIFPPAKKLKNPVTFIISYGDWGNMAYMIPIAKELREKGYRVITYDYRGFGKSDSFNISRTNLYYNEFVFDLLSVIDYTWDSFPDDKVALLGISMGSLISSFAASEIKVDFLVADSYISDPWMLMERLETSRRVNLHLPQSGVGYPKKIAQIEAPMLIFAGTKDAYTPVKESIYVVKQKTNREMIAYNGGHASAFEVLSGERLGARFVDYIDNWIQNREWD